MKSVLTCMAVCKSWYSLIKSPLFINTHVSRPNNNEYYLCSSKHSPHYWIDCYDSKEQRLRKYYDLESSVPVSPWEIEIVGSCNGLICYTADNHHGFKSIYMWNPAIQKMKSIPEPVYYNHRAAYGFWFCTDSRDYKVARICYKKKYLVEVYSLSTNSWNMINICSPSDPRLGIHMTDNVVHINGTLYWLTLRRDYWMFISLNTKNGMFREILIWPAENKRSKFQLVKSGVQCNYLFVSRSPWLPYFDWNALDLRVYDESLKQLYKIDLDRGKVRTTVIGVRNNQEVLLQRHENCENNEILVCNVEESKFQRFSPPAPVTIVGLQPFVETLVLLNDEATSSTSCVLGDVLL